MEPARQVSTQLSPGKFECSWEACTKVCCLIFPLPLYLANLRYRVLIARPGLLGIIVFILAKSRIVAQLMVAPKSLLGTTL